MMKRIGMRRLAAFAAAAALVLCLVGCGGAQSTAQGNTEPVDLSVWTYYNGDQLESFNKLVDTFNDTVGKEKNITVESYSQGSVNDLEAQVMAAAQGKVGASAMPNIFMAYADTAYAMDQMGELADLAPYFTDEERAAYVDSYLTEGDFDDSGSIKIFPVAKSTELLFLNDTDWKPFAAATGAQYSDLETVEGLVKTAEAYYNWTDAQTDTPNDGKALFGRDAVANYMLIGAKELGDTIFDVKDGKMTMGLSEDAARKLWDNYYVPYIKGWAAASGRFRSDDIKIGSILAYIGSNSSATYFPTQVSRCPAGCRYGRGKDHRCRGGSQRGFPQVVHPTGKQHRICSGFRLSARDPCRQRYGCYLQQRPRPDRQHGKCPDGGRGGCEYQ